MTCGWTSANAPGSGLAICPVVPGPDRASTAGRGEYAEKFETSARPRNFLTAPNSSTAARGPGEGDPGGGNTDGCRGGLGSRGELTSSVRRLLQAIYDLLRDRSAWPMARPRRRRSASNVLRGARTTGSTEPNSAS